VFMHPDNNEMTLGLDMWHDGRLSLTLPMSCKVIDQNSRTPAEKWSFSATYQRYEAIRTFRIARGQHQTCTKKTIYWLFIEFIELKWSMRPRVGAFLFKQGVALTGRNSTGPPPNEYVRHGVLRQTPESEYASRAPLKF